MLGRLPRSHLAGSILWQDRLIYDDDKNDDTYDKSKSQLRCGSTSTTRFRIPSGPGRNTHVASCENQIHIAAASCPRTGLRNSLTDAVMLLLVAAPLIIIQIRFHRAKDGFAGDVDRGKH